MTEQLLPGLQADLKAMDDAQKESQIDPKHAVITLVAGLAVRYYLMDVIKLLIILAILLGDASFVTVLYVRYDCMCRQQVVSCALLRAL